MTVRMTVIMTHVVSCMLKMKIKSEENVDTDAKIDGSIYMINRLV